jgi:hypothetical protein
LIYIHLGNTKNLTGGIPTNISNLKKLEYLDVSGNQLTGILPTSLSAATKLRSIYLDRNQLSGAIPPQYSLLDSLESFDLAYNNFTGTVPFILSKIKKLAYFGIDNNRFDSLPNFSGGFLRYNEAPYDKGFYVSKNRFTFDDILPNMPLSTKGANFKYQYWGQDSIICKESRTTTNSDKYFQIALKIDGGLTTNVYRWFKDGKLIDRTNVNFFSIKGVIPCQAGNYSCEVTNPAVPGMTLYCPNQYLDVPAEPINPCEPYALTVFPNPVQNVLNITITSPPDDVRLIKMYNMLGQEILNQRFDDGVLLNGLAIDCATMPNGSYFLSLFTEGGQISRTQRVQVLKK